MLDDAVTTTTSPNFENHPSELWSKAKRGCVREMTVHYTEQTLDENICEVVRRKLEHGNFLAKRLTQRLAQHSFRVRSLLPEGVLAERTLEIEHGGLFPTDISKSYTSGGYTAVPINDELSNSWLYEQILAYLKTDSESFVIFEDANANKGNPYLAKETETEIWYCDEEVFRVVTASDATEDRIRIAIRKSFSFHVFIGVVCCGTRIVANARTPGEFSQQDIEEISTGAKAIIIGAYDGEGYLLCDELNGANQ